MEKLQYALRLVEMLAFLLGLCALQFWLRQYPRVEVAVRAEVPCDLARREDFVGDSALEVGAEPEAHPSSKSLVEL